MIKYVKGDVVEAFKNGKVDVLIHQCNAQGVMGSGIARQIKDTFPQVFADYKKYKLNLGDCIETNVFRLGKRSGTVVNLIGQDHYIPRGLKHTSYDALDAGLKLISNTSHRTEIIAMPKIGAGLGGGDWKIIEAIINSHFPDREILVYELE